MFSFDVPLWQWIVSQVFALVSMALMFYSLQTKSQVRTLWATVGSNLTLAVSATLLLNWVLFGILLIGAARDVCYLGLKKARLPLRHPVSIFVLVLFLGLIAVTVTFTHNGWWFNWVMLFTSSFLVIGYWVRNIHWLRASRTLASIALIVNHLHFSNYIGVLMDAMSLVSIAIFYSRKIFAKKMNSTYKLSNQ